MFQFTICCRSFIAACLHQGLLWYRSTCDSQGNESTGSLQNRLQGEFLPPPSIFWYVKANFPNPTLSEQPTGRVISILHDECSSDLSVFQRQLHNEIKIASSIRHPNLNGIIGVYEKGEKVHMFFELITGGDLFAYLEKHGE